MADTPTAPVITGVDPAGVITFDEAPILLFPNVTITDEAPNAIESVLIEYDAYLPTLTGDFQGRANPSFFGLHSYPLTGTADQVTAELRQVTASGGTLSLSGGNGTVPIGLSVASSGDATTSGVATSYTDVRQRITVDPTVSFKGGAFTITGLAESSVQGVSVELFGDVDGVETDLGAATLEDNGVTYQFVDRVGAHTQSFITAVETDRLGYQTTVAVPFSLTAGIGGKPYVGEQDSFDPDSGSYTGSTFFHRDGSVEATTHDAPDGTETWSQLFRADGRTLVDVTAPGLTLPSASFDIFEIHGQPNTTFVFHPGHGLDVLHEFRANGSDHDTLDFSRSGFTDVAQVLQNTKKVAGGVLITDPVEGDTVKILDVSKGELRRNQADIAVT